MDSSCPTVITLIAFLTHMFNKGIGFSQINTARSAISVLYSLSGPRLGDGPLVSRFMRGVQNLRQPQPKYPILWDVSVLLLHLQGWNVSTLHDMSMKLVTLLAVLSAQRLHTLSHIAVGSIVFAADCSYLSVFEDLKVAHSRPKFVIALPGSASPDPLRVISLLQSYIKLTASLRPKDMKFLFRSYCKPHKCVSSNTLSRWARSIMSAAGINVSKFGSHSVRGASASAVRNANVPLEAVLSAGDWSTAATFTRHYHRPVANLPEPAVWPMLLWA